MFLIEVVLLRMPFVFTPIVVQAHFGVHGVLFSTSNKVIPLSTSFFVAAASIEVNWQKSWCHVSFVPSTIDTAANYPLQMVS